MNTSLIFAIVIVSLVPFAIIIIHLRSEAFLRELESTELASGAGAPEPTVPCLECGYPLNECVCDIT